MIGETIKVYLPGESPWAEITAEEDGRVKARILNKLFHEFSEHEQARWLGDHFGTVKPLERLHSYKQGDELWFTKDEHNNWIPDVSEQR